MFQVEDDIDWMWSVCFFAMVEYVHFCKLVLRRLLLSGERLRVSVCRWLVGWGLDYATRT